MNILILSPYPVGEEAFGGMKRLSNFVQYLRKNNRVYVVHFNHQGKKAEEASHYNLPFERPSHTISQRFFYKCLRFKPSYVTKCFSKEMARSLADILLREKIDLLHIEFTYMGEYVRHIKEWNGVKVLVEQELSSRRMKMETGGRIFSLHSLFYWMEFLKMKTYEVTISKEFKKVYQTTETEKDIHLSYDETLDIEVFPNVIDIAFFDPSQFPATEKKNSLVFLGDFSHSPNQRGSHWFCSKVFPKIIEHHPDAKLYIVGANADRDILALSEAKGIEVTGRVDEIRSYLKECSVFINPMISGGGMRGKVLEAMAMERPVVSTSLGAEGIDGISGKNFILADSPEDFAKGILDLFSDQELRKSIGIHARTLVEKRYSNQHVFPQMEKKYEKLLQNYKK